VEDNKTLGIYTQTARTFSLKSTLESPTDHFSFTWSSECVFLQNRLDGISASRKGKSSWWSYNMHSRITRNVYLKGKRGLLWFHADYLYETIKCCTFTSILFEKDIEKATLSHILCVSVLSIPPSAYYVWWISDSMFVYENRASFGSLANLLVACSLV